MRSDLPTPGDVVVYRRDAPGSVYLLSAFRHASRLTFHTHDDAIRDATRIAATNHVDAWYTADGQLYRSIARHRAQRLPLRTAA